MTKTLKPLHKHYEHLDALERYKLFARALERDDKEEINRLFNTCPYEETLYRVRDRDFVHIYERSQRICAVFTEWFTLAFYQITLLMQQFDFHLSTDMVNLCVFASGFLEADGQLSREELDAAIVVEELKQVFNYGSLGIGGPDRWKEEFAVIKERIGELKAIYGAMQKFCDEAGLEMDDILCWNSRIKRTIMLAKGYLERPIAMDETFLDVLHRGFRSIWTGIPERYPAPYTEEEIEQYGREVKQGTEGYDAIDIYASNDKVDGAERT